MYDSNMARAIIAALRADLPDPHRCFAVEVHSADHASQQPTVTVTAPYEYTRLSTPEFGQIEAIVEQAVGRPVEALAPVPVPWRSGKPRRGRVAFLVEACASDGVYPGDAPPLPRQRDGEAPEVRA